MSRYVEFALPDGSVVTIESDEPETGPIKAARGGEIAERARETFEQAAESARKAALVILGQLRGLHDSPDEIEIAFGLKASGELGSLVVAKSGVEANYSVRLTWKKTETSPRVRPRSVRRPHLRRPG